jgi:ketosteroid isomerase-like protein
MPEEPTTPDLVERLRRSVDALNRGDWDTALAIYAPDAVWDTSPVGLGIYEGLDVMREFFEDWVGTFEDFAAELDEVRNLDNEVVFFVLVHRGRPAGSSGSADLRQSYTAIYADGLITRVTARNDIDEGRAAAERLAEERG